MVVVSRRPSEQTAMARLDYRDGRTTQLEIIRSTEPRRRNASHHRPVAGLDLALQTERPWKVISM